MTRIPRLSPHLAVIESSSLDQAIGSRCDTLGGWESIGDEWLADHNVEWGYISDHDLDVRINAFSLISSLVTQRHSLRGI